MSGTEYDAACQIQLHIALEVLPVCILITQGLVSKVKVYKAYEVHVLKKPCNLPFTWDMNCVITNMI